MAMRESIAQIADDFKAANEKLNEGKNYHAK
jgi:hypothetical protein